MTSILLKHRHTWQNKKLLRDIYTEWYKIIVNNLSNIPGKTLELGSGSGNFKEYKPDTISSDINPQPWLDMSFDAHTMPFKKNTLSNIVMIDVLHHLQNPVLVFDEAYRVLNRGGRIIMIEPYPSFVSKIIYKLFHPEPFIYNIDYFENTTSPDVKNPWSSNQAIPYLIFFKHFNQFSELFSKYFKIITRDKFSYILYPLSGGFENKQLIPDLLIPVVKLLENLLYPFRNIFAFRCLIVLEKL